MSLDSSDFLVSLNSGHSIEAGLLEEKWPGLEALVDSKLGHQQKAGNGHHLKHGN